MPVRPTYPGVYIEEASSQSHLITGVPTANTAFVDVFERGPDNVPTPISNFGEFQATFGGIMRQSRASYGINQFFMHGGSMAWVVRVPGKTAVLATGECDPLGDVQAIGTGTWGNNIQVAAEQSGSTFNMVVRELLPGSGTSPDVSCICQTPA